ncbi:hypothetical protein BLNAU_1474 [Blattamonas nauphoetae]|uniref:Uncharacterized protein n=1 Tax=Blattamonas nauphoetae TaxID=2049346 RepID=A0ABQ9YI66_9EUKA|nr:hypothetical protein BLNAU_1474 [Blattamonas nauphoetae]
MDEDLVTGDCQSRLIVAEFEVQSDIKKIKLRISEITLFSRKIGFPRRNKPEEQDGQEEVFEDQQEYGKEEGNSFDSQPDKEPEHHSETNDNDDEIVKKEHFRETEGGEEGSTACTLLRFDDCVSQNMIVMQHDIPVSHNFHQRVHHTFARGLLSSAQSDIKSVILHENISRKTSRSFCSYRKARCRFPSYSLFHKHSEKGPEPSPKAAQPIPNNAEPSPPPQLPPQQKKQREVQFQPQFISQQPAEKMRQPERQKSSSGTDTTQLISDEEPNGLLKGQYMDVELWPMMRDPLDGGFTAPAFTIPSSAGLVAFHSLPDQIHVLCQDEDGIVSMWNILTGKLEETLGPGRLEDFAKRFPKPLEFRRKWYTAETKTGTFLDLSLDLPLVDDDFAGIAFRGEDSDGNEQMDGETEIKHSYEFELDQFTPFSSGSNLVGDFCDDDLSDNDTCECDNRNDGSDFDQLAELDEDGDENDETRSCSAVSI